MIVDIKQGIFRLSGFKRLWRSATAPRKNGQMIMSKPVVLVVEDDDSSQQIYCDLLERLPAEFHVASSIRDARRQIEEIDALDLVLLDFELPDGIGLDLVGALKAKFPSVDILLVTAMHICDVQAQAKEFGIHTIINKPLIPSQFRKFIEARLKPEAQTPPPR